RKQPNTAIDHTKVKIQVFFYDTVNDKDIKLTDADVNYEWVTPKHDWTDTNPEILSVNYLRPKMRGVTSEAALSETASAGKPSQNGRQFFMLPIALFYRVIKYILLVVCVFLFAVTGEAQIQVDLKFKRLQYIAYEPVVATLAITNLAGRDVDLHDADGQSWFGFEVTGSEGQPIPPIATDNAQPPLKIEAGQKVTQRINLTPLYPVHDFGTYHVRAHIYFPDLEKFFYSG